MCRHEVYSQQAHLPSQDTNISNDQSAWTLQQLISCPSTCKHATCEGASTGVDILALPEQVQVTAGGWSSQCRPQLLGGWRQRDPWRLWCSQATGMQRPPSLMPCRLSLPHMCLPTSASTRLLSCSWLHLPARRLHKAVIADQYALPVLMTALVIIHCRCLLADPSTST